MPTLERVDLDELRRGARSLLRNHWPDARHAASADLGTFWSNAVEAGWFGAAQDDLLSAMFALIDELGRAACPLPLAEAFVTIQLFPELAAEVAGGAVRPGLALLPTGSSTPHVEAAPAATHVLSLAAGSRAELRVLRAMEPVRGVPTPAWYRVTLADDALFVNERAGEARRASELLQLAFAARALAAARRAHELSLQHAQLRRQFGQLVGSFGAVQQRAATAQIDADAGQLLLEQAIRCYEERSSEWPRANQLACAFASQAARRVQVAAHHTLAASGFFEESEAPWLFRRVQADIACLLQLGAPDRALGESLVRSRVSLPSLGLGDVAARFRAELCRVLDAPEMPRCAPGIGPDDDSVVQRLVRHDLLGRGWPREWGGVAASPEELAVLVEELNYRRLPVWQAIGAVLMLAGALLRYGSEAQKARFLPLIRQGKLKFCLGYSEPESGSDLASLRTQAARDGEEWIINGEKIWTSGADYSDYVWLAVKTDPAAVPPHAGISIFLVPLKTPGIRMTPHRALSGEISCSVLFENVRVADAARIGEVNQGWSVIQHALAGERIVLASWAASLHRQLDELVRVLGSDRVAHLVADSHVTARVGAIAAEIQATRLLMIDGVQRFEDPAIGALRALEAKVLAGETAERLAAVVVEILGGAALIESSWVPCADDAGFEYHLRLCMMFVIGGGTNDVLRGRIARLLGLPK
jgi:alkylation response protein AidB-like acyl-CoA dehydrogenase